MDIAGVLVQVVRKLAEQDSKLDRILLNQRTMIMSEADFQASLKELQAQVAAEESVGDSMMTLMEGLGDQLRQVANDPAAVATIAASLKTKADAWSAAVTANTPATPPVAVVPSPIPDPAPVETAPVTEPAPTAPATDAPTS